MIDPAIQAAYRDTEAHLTALSAKMAGAGGPCHRCKHGTKLGGYSWDRKCRHPFVRRGDYNAVTGKTTWNDGDQTQMRKGVCGPDGKLFEIARVDVLAWRWARAHWWIGFVLALAGYCYGLFSIIAR